MEVELSDVAVVETPEGERVALELEELKEDPVSVTHGSCFMTQRGQPPFLRLSGPSRQAALRIQAEAQERNEAIHQRLSASETPWLEPLDPKGGEDV